MHILFNIDGRSLQCQCFITLLAETRNVKFSDSFRTEEFTLFSGMTSCVLFPRLINITGEEKREAGAGTPLYSCYSMSENRKYVVSWMFSNGKYNYKWIKSMTSLVD